MGLHAKYNRNILDCKIVCVQDGFQVKCKRKELPVGVRNNAGIPRCYCGLPYALQAHAAGRYNA